MTIKAIGATTTTTGKTAITMHIATTAMIMLNNTFNMNFKNFFITANYIIKLITINNT